jgi:molybdenum cofactor cytidylyltransferase
MHSFAVIPAAGRSRRMGRPKLLLPWGNSTVIDHVLAAWRASRVDQIVLVHDPADRELADRATACGAIAAACSPPPPEMKDSVWHGLGVLERAFHPLDEDAWLVAPADVPGLSTRVIDRLIDAYAASVGTPDGCCIRAPRRGAKGGHPVLFPWPLAAEVRRLAADEGLNTLIARHRVEYLEIDEQDACGDDLDTPADYERLRSRFGK